MLSELFLEFPSRVRLGSPKPYNSRQLKPREHFQNFLPPQYSWGRLFFQKWLRRGPLRAGHGIPSNTEGIYDLGYWIKPCFFLFLRMCFCVSFTFPPFFPPFRLLLLTGISPVSCSPVSVFLAYVLPLFAPESFFLSCSLLFFLLSLSALLVSCLTKFRNDGAGIWRKIPGTFLSNLRSCT